MLKNNILQISYINISTQNNAYVLYCKNKIYCNMVYYNML